MTITENLERLATAMNEQALMRERMQPYVDEERQLRTSILEEMQANSIKRMEGGGLMAVEVVTKDLAVVDVDALTECLHDFGLFERCTKTTTSFVMPEIRKMAKETTLRGVEPTESRTIRIKALDAVSS